MVMNGFDTDVDGENEFYTVNGVANYFADHPIELEVGELVRVYLVNMTEFDLINSFHLHGNVFKLFRTGTNLEALRDHRHGDAVPGGAGGAGVQLQVPRASTCSTPTRASSRSSAGWASSTSRPRRPPSACDRARTAGEHDAPHESPPVASPGGPARPSPASLLAVLPSSCSRPWSTFRSLGGSLWSALRRCPPDALGQTRHRADESSGPDEGSTSRVREHRPGRAHHRPGDRERCHLAVLGGSRPHDRPAWARHGDDLPTRGSRGSPTR